MTENTSNAPVKVDMWVWITLGTVRKVGYVKETFVEGNIQKVDVYVPEKKEVYKRCADHVQPIPEKMEKEDLMELINLSIDSKDKEWFSELCARMIKGVK